jgi:phosphate transport system permease protein
MSSSVLLTGASGSEPSFRSLEAPSPRYGEKLIRLSLWLSAVISVIVTTGIVLALLLPSLQFFQQVSIVEFLTGTIWAPAFATPAFGVLPIVVGTLMVVTFALIVAIPVGLSSAIYLSEYANPRARQIIKPVLEVLEGIPTVAIGLFAFAVLTPTIRDLTPFLPWTGPFSIGVAGLAVGLLIIPLVASVSDDAMRAVPRSLRDGAYAMGATKFEVATRVILPAAISGVIAAFVLGISRAIGETMIVLLVAGAGNPILSFDPTKGTQTMTAYIGSTATGDISQGTITYDSIFAVGALLFLMTLLMNMISIRLVRKFREVYD